MHIAFSGGKTLGHVIPLINIIEHFKDSDFKYTYFGLQNALEEKECLKRNIPFVALNLYPFYRKNIFKNFKTFYAIAKERKRLITYIKEHKIDCCCVSGGFVAIPLVLACKKLKKKIIVLEMNAVMGLGNKWLSRYAYKVLLTFPLDNPKPNYLEVGNPPFIIKSFYNHEIFLRKEYKVLIVAGSQGATYFITLAKHLAYKELANYVFLVVLGAKHEQIKLNHPNIYQVAYIPNLGGCINQFDFVISRAGSSTLSEILAAKRKALIIPSPNVANNHQECNAKILYDLGLIYMLKEKDALVDIVLSELSRLTKDYKIDNALATYHTRICNPNYYKILTKIISE